VCENNAKTEVSGNLGIALKSFIRKCIECFKYTKEVKLRQNKTSGVELECCINFM